MSEVQKVQKIRQSSPSGPPSAAFLRRQTPLAYHHHTPRTSRRAAVKHYRPPRRATENAHSPQPLGRSFGTHSAPAPPVAARRGHYTVKRFDGRADIIKKLLDELEGDALKFEGIYFAEYRLGEAALKLRAGLTSSKRCSTTWAKERPNLDAPIPPSRIRRPHCSKPRISLWRVHSEYLDLN